MTRSAARVVRTRPWRTLVMSHSHYQHVAHLDREQKRSNRRASTSPLASQRDIGKYVTVSLMFLNINHCHWCGINWRKVQNKCNLYLDICVVPLFGRKSVTASLPIFIFFLVIFYRAMHFSANARYWDRMSSVCPSVCPSVTLVDCDHIGWKSGKLIARTISPIYSVFVAKRRSAYSQGNMGKFWGY